ncbi:uncharacterized protein [Henckelia pumila]|uniref:uncharacterized protein isoform X2 n=1 Tax=Henckelia pumila TaxID=405737 RepID=UPI003C6DDDF7
MAHLVHDSNRGKQTLSYQSSWMSRWMRTSCNRTGESINHSSDASVNDLNCITKDILATSRSFKGLGMIETVTSELVNGGPRPSTESSLRNESSCRYLFEDMGASAFETGHKFECGEAIYLKNGIQLQPVLHAIPAVADNDTSFRGCHFLDAVTSKHNRLDHANLRILPHKGGPSASSDKDFHMEANSDSSSSKSNLCMDNSPIAEPGYRWVKRLKLSSCHSSARGTESVNPAENSSRKRNNVFSRVRRSDITRSESTLRTYHGEESMALDKSINLSKENLGNDLSPSHVWIQRWLRDGSKSTRKKPYTMVVSEPQSLIWAFEDLQKDRSPSVRAMAMMGKAIKNFQPCQLEKRGSLTIWNTKDV